MNYRILTGLLLALFSTITLAITDDDLLEPGKAFRFSASPAGESTIRAQWDIADSYYLYQDRIRFSTNTPGFRLGIPKLPPAKIIEDEFFGQVGTYRGVLTIDLPVERRPGAPDTIELLALSQGCADIGICYPPQTQVAMIEMPPVVVAEPDPEPAPAPSALDDLGALEESLGLGAGDDDFMEPDAAFRLYVDTEDPENLSAQWVIAEGYYLYRDKIGFQLVESEQTTLEPALFPSGKIKEDEYFGRMEVYYGDLKVRIPLKRSGTTEEDIQLRVSYQGCAEAGICYPPINKTLELTLPAADTATLSTVPAVTDTTAVTKPAPAQTPPSARQDDISRVLAESGKWWVILFFFGAGVLLAFTACMYPMIPILSSIIVGQGETITTGKAFFLSLVYVQAMAITYAIIGVISAQLGAGVQAFFQNPWILASFAIIFVLLALSMFGFYNLQLPASWQARLSETSNRQKGGHLLGVAVMGVLSALIVGPCAGPVLIGALAYTSQSGDYLTGGLAMFALGNGMGAPLLLIGASGGKLLPKAGGWMDTVKSVFGVILLGVAVLMLERILPGPVALFLWAMLLIIPAIYMGALEPLAEGTSGWRRLWKGLGIVMLTYGIILVLGAATGARDPFQPLRNFTVGISGTETGGSTSQHLAFDQIKTVADLEAALLRAEQLGKYTMLDYYADWCTYCIKMEDYTFSDKRVQKALSDMILLQADVTANDEADKELLNHFGLFAPPATLFFTSEGSEKRNFRLVGYIGADEFLEHLDSVRREK